MKFKVTTEDEKEAKRLVQSEDMAMCIWELLQNLPKRTEHAIDETEDSYKAHEIIWTMIREEFESINIIDLIKLK